MKRIMIVLALAVALLAAESSFAQTATYRTSLSAALTQAGLTLTVAATTNMTASTQTVTEYGVISDGQGNAELVKINSITGLAIGVTRGQGGIQSAHVSGAVFFYGPGGGAAAGTGTPFTNTSPNQGTPCTATGYLFLPIVNYANGSVWNCANSRWVNGGYGVTGVTAAYTATLGDYIIAYTTVYGGAKTVTLPAPVAGLRGKVYIIKNESSVVTNTIWVYGNTTLDGSAGSLAVYGSGGGTATTGTSRVYTDGSAWYSF